MKRPIGFYERVIEYKTRSIASLRDDIDSTMRALKAQETERDLLQAQVDLAKKERKDGFDRDKYAIKRLCV